MTRPSIGDPRFFARSGPHPLRRVAEAAAGAAPPDADLLLAGVAPLHAAGPQEVGFLDNRRYASALEATSAGAVIVHPDMRVRVPEGTVPIVTTERYVGPPGPPMPRIRGRPRWVVGSAPPRPPTALCGPRRRERVNGRAAAPFSVTTAALVVPRCFWCSPS